ncbi:MAG: NPCBM/NEW2 domain-containing protein [Phycisphaerae bacterium]|nr:NPCBM/NEW2 domain-containing protein [Phycisphaerae bacterium]
MGFFGRVGLVGIAVACFNRCAPAATEGEMMEARRWVAAKFEGVQRAEKPRSGLVVLANHGPVQKNARSGEPLRIVGKEYKRGLYCHAPSNVVVRLPGPGKTFTSVVGIDARAGGGSIVFSVGVGGKEAFRTGVMHVNDAGVPVEVDLKGATEFSLLVGDSGDGIGCDQADWAEAKVVLVDGKEVWLGDLPLLDVSRAPYTTECPISFTYDGRPFAEVVKTWELKRDARKLDDQRTERTLTYTDPKTGLVVRCVGIEYHDFPTIEWTPYFKNTGTVDTPILADIHAVDMRLGRNAGGEFVLHHYTGSPCLPNDYEPHAMVLGAKASKRITTSGGRPTNSDLPYFNIESPGGGVIVAIGWPGQWAATFERDEGNGLHIRGGQELTRFKLLPGEEVRGPLVAVQFYEGDRVRAQNVWRRWMLAHSTPRPGGKPLRPQIAAVSGNHYPGLMCNQADEILFINRYLEEGVTFDYWWMDAGWYPCAPEGWPKTGTWEVDKERFPGGLRAVTDHARTKGIKSIVWFEPERVTPGTWLYEKHPEWLLGKDGGTKLLNLGNGEARKWLTDHIDRVLTEQGIDLYRQDFNMDPLAYWRGNDSPDRQGITEIRHVEGYLAFWDELLRRHPGMLIDSCASGGRRNDLETLRRAVPLLRSDYIFEPVGEQCHAYGISFWMPFHGTGFIDINTYLVRSLMSPQLTLGQDMRRKDLDYALLRKLIDEWRKVSDCYLGDYYPMTPYSLGQDVWLALQFDRPEAGKGVVHAFRRAESIYESARMRLRGLEAGARYRVTDLDRAKPVEVSGAELMEKGLLVVIEGGPGSAVVMYERI